MLLSTVEQPFLVLQGEAVLRDGDRYSEDDLLFQIRGVFVAENQRVHAMMESTAPGIRPLLEPSDFEQQTPAYRQGLSYTIMETDSFLPFCSLTCYTTLHPAASCLCTLKACNCLPCFIVQQICSSFRRGRFNQTDCVILKAWTCCITDLIINMLLCWQGSSEELVLEMAAFCRKGTRVALPFGGDGKSGISTLLLIH